MKEPEASSAVPAKAGLRSGEKVFTVVLFLLGAFAFVQSLMLWLRMSQPRISSAAALPLFVSAVWMVFSFIIIIENIKKSTPLSGKEGFKVVRQGLKYAFPRKTLAMLVAVIAYCVCLLLQISFYIATPLFLWGSMCYLTRGGYLKNMLWTAVCMAFIILVFRLLFGVVLP